MNVVNSQVSANLKPERIKEIIGPIDWRLFRDHICVEHVCR